VPARPLTLLEKVRGDLPRMLEVVDEHINAYHRRLSHLIPSGIDALRDSRKGEYLRHLREAVRLEIAGSSSDGRTGSACSTSSAGSAGSADDHTDDDDDEAHEVKLGLLSEMLEIYEALSRFATTNSSGAASEADLEAQWSTFYRHDQTIVGNGNESAEVLYESPRAGKPDQFRDYGPAQVGANRFLGVIECRSSVGRGQKQVKCKGLNFPIIIDSPTRALEGDEVIVQVKPEQNWRLNDGLFSHQAASSGGGGASRQVGRTATELEAVEYRELLWGHTDDVMGPLRYEWAASGREANRDPVAEGINDRARQLTRQPVGFVKSIVKRNHRKTVSGVLQRIVDVPANERDNYPSNLENIMLLAPFDEKFPLIYVDASKLQPALRDRIHEHPSSFVFEATIRDWPVKFKYPRAESIELIEGPFGSLAAELKCALVDNGVDVPAYDEQSPLGIRARAELSTILGFEIPYLSPPASGHSLLPPRIEDWPISPLEGRRDLRGCCIFSIDPSTSRDMDDALHITELADGTFEVGIHIADPSYFIQEGSALDNEARARGTTIYLPGEVRSMIPKILADDFCSLNPNEDRLAVTVVIRLDKHGNMVLPSTALPATRVENQILTAGDGNSNSWFGRTVVRSYSKMDYRTASQLVDFLRAHPSAVDNASDTDFATAISDPSKLWEASRRPTPESGFSCHKIARDIWLLNQVAQNRRVTRFRSGTMEIKGNNPMTFHLNPDGSVASAVAKTEFETQKLVEEYMLLGNFLIAERLLLRVGPAAFLRQEVRIRTLTYYVYVCSQIV
jgi:RNB domain/Dis3-like cold-shock domain 2 (CSD2)